MAKSTIKVRSTGTGETFDASSSDAQEAFARGTVELEDDEIRVVSGDNQSGTVSRANLSEALAQGWSIASDAEAEAKTLRREASGVVGTVVGSGEAIIRGASVGLSDPILVGLGRDAKKLRANQEALGEIGTGLEVGGAVAAALLTGGGGAAAQGAARGTAFGAAKALARRSAGYGTRLVGAPTRLATRAGDAVAGALAGTEAGLGRQVAARVAGGAVEGGIGGLGGVVSESVLHEKPMTAEALLGGLAAGAVFGGALDGGATAGLGGLARGTSAAFGGLARGVGATRGAVRKLLARETGMAVDAVPDELVHAAMGDDWIATAAEKLAPWSGADPTIAKRAFGGGADQRRRIHDLMTRRPQIEQEIAETFQTKLNDVRRSLEEARIRSQGEAKYASMVSKLPQNADYVGPRLTEELRGKFQTRLESMAEENARHSHRLYDVAALREGTLLAKRAGEEMKIDLSVPTDTGDVAMASFRALDRFKRDLTEQIAATGGWGAPKPGSTTDVAAVNKEFREMYKEVREHLERNDLWGDAADQQRELNGSFARGQRAAAEFKNIATGSGVRGLFAADGSVNMRQAITLARQFRRMGGSEVVSKFDEVLEAQLDHLRVVRNHYDLGREELHSIQRAESAVREIRDRMATQAEDAALLDDLDSLRGSEGASSVSIGALSSVGPGVGALVGYSALGPVGGAIGAVAGSVLRPYTSIRTLASLQVMSDRFKKSFNAKGFVRGLAKAGSSTAAKAKAKLEELGREARKAAHEAGKVAKRGGKGLVVGGALQAGQRGNGYQTTSDRQRQLALVADRVAELGTYENLKKALGPEWEVLAGEMPELAQEFEVVLQRAATYLDQHRPPITRRPFSGRPPIVDPVAASRFMRRYEAVTQPERVLERLREGTLTLEHVDALRTVYPRHYQGLVDGIAEALAEADEKGRAPGGCSAARSCRPLPAHRDRVKLGLLLGQPLDASLEPAHQLAMGRVYGPAQPPAGQPGGQGSPSPGSTPSGKVRGPGVDRMSFDRLDTPAAVTASGRLRA